MASRYLIDTHVIVEFSVPGGLEAMPAKVRRILENPDVERLFSAVSEVELAIKSRLGKLQLTRDDLTLVYEKTIIKSYPFRREHADRLFDLALHHKDPFDRMIIATALADDLPVITRDRQFRQYRGLQVIW